MSQTKQDEIKAQVTSILKEVEANPLKLRIVIQRLCEENASLKDQLAITEQKLQVFEQARAGIKAASITSPEPSSPRSAKRDNGPSPQKRRKSHKQQAASITSPEPSSPRSASNDAGASPQKRCKTQKQQDPEDRRRATEELWKAVKEGEDDRAVEAAVEAGADVRARGVLGETPLHWAARSGREAAVLYLISHGAELEAKCKFGSTPLHWAARKGREAVVLYLISHGAELEVKNVYGETPLHEAVSYGHLPCTKLLVERGADPNDRTSGGRTPLALAWHPTVQQYLRSVGGT